MATYYSNTMARRRASQVADPQVVRALSLLLAMANSKRGVLLKHFAEQRHYSLRGVYRARDVLVKVGAPIRQNPESPTRWQLMDGWLPPAIVGPAKEELIALFVARQLAPGLRGTSVGRALESLWSKLTSSGPQQVLPLAENIPLSVRAPMAIDYSDHRNTIDHLENAIRGRYAVRLEYRAPDGTITERVVEPGFLHWDGGLEAIYVPSWCRLRGALRVFAVHRILALEPLPDDPSYSVPARKRMERAFRIWYRDTVEHVHIAFTASVAGEIRERRWHASQRVTEAADGALRLELQVSAPQELERWLLGFGSNARVIEPSWLAERIRQVHASAAGVGEVIDVTEPRRSSVRSRAPMRSVRAVGTRRAR